MLCMSNRKSFSILLIYGQNFFCHIFDIFLSKVNLFFFVNKDIALFIIRYMIAHFFNLFFISIIFHIPIIFRNWLEC